VGNQRGDKLPSLGQKKNAANLSWELLKKNQPSLPCVRRKKRRDEKRLSEEATIGHSRRIQTWCGEGSSTIELGTPPTRRSVGQIRSFRHHEKVKKDQRGKAAIYSLQREEQQKSSKGKKKYRFNLRILSNNGEEKDGLLR